MARILVTGGAGFIGSHVSRLLLDEGFEVVIIDNLSKGYRKAVDERAKFVEMDLSDKQRLVEVFAEEKIDAVLHFAGSIEVGQSMKEPDLFFKNNLFHGVNLLEAMRSVGTNKIIFSSTAAVYGYPKSVPIREDAELKPINFYGQSKLMFEQILKNYDAFYGFNYVALRYFNACGAFLDGSLGQNYRPCTHLIPQIFRALKGETDCFKIYGDDYNTPDGTCIRDYVHVMDLADAHLRALRYLLNGGSSDVFNLGNGQGFSVKEVLSTVESVIGVKVPTAVVERRAGDPDRLVADSSKIFEKLKWKPQFSDLRTIIDSAWKHEEFMKKSL